MWKNIKMYFVMIVREVYNFVTDLAVPVVGVATIIATVLPIPTKYVAMLKIAEEFLKKFGATKQEVENRMKNKVV